MKKFFICLSLILLVFFISGCSNDDSVSKNYTVTIKAIDSDENIIETAEVSVKGKDKIGENGVLQITLAKGTYTAVGTDTANVFIDTEQNFTVSSDTIVPLKMYKDSKTITITAVDENTNEKIDNAIINIDGVEGKNTEDGYVVTLKIDETYTVNVTEEFGYYKETDQDITINTDTNTVEIPLAKTPTGTVQGNLYMTSSYNNPVLLNYGFVSYFDQKITSGDNVYSIVLPEGERELTITTNFGGETTVNVTVIAGETVNEDVYVPLPDGFSVDKWMNGYLDVPMVANGNYALARWNRQTVTYSIDYTDWVKEDYEGKTFGLDFLANVVRDGVKVMDAALGSVIDYQEIDDYNSADVKFLVCHDGDSYIGKAKGKIADQQLDGSEVIGSTLYLNAAHMTTSAGDDIVAHEMGHSLALGHSPDPLDLMYYSPGLDLEGWINTDRVDSDRMILGLLYSMPYPTHNPFVQ